MAHRLLLGVNVDIAPTSIGALIQSSGSTTYVLGVLYAIALVYAVRRFLLIWWGEHRAWDTPRLFVASIVFATIVRSLSFITLAILSFENVSVNSNNESGSDEQFYELVLAVLFNVGDWACVSTYLLLIIVWVEMLQRAVKHFYSQERIRRRWLIAYLACNTCMYLVQIGLYVSLFTTKSSPQSILNAIYAVIAFLNFAVPCVLVCTWLTFAVLFAGFPYRTAQARNSWLRFSRLVVGWTLGRIVWAIMAVFSASDALVSVITQHGDWVFAVVIVTVFVLAELLPFLASLGTDVLALFSPLPGQATSPVDSGVHTPAHDAAELGGSVIGREDVDAQDAGIFSGTSLVTGTAATHERLPDDEEASGAAAADLEVLLDMHGAGAKTPPTARSLLRGSQPLMAGTQRSDSTLRLSSTASLTRITAISSQPSSTSLTATTASLRTEASMMIVDASSNGGEHKAGSVRSPERRGDAAAFDGSRGGSRRGTATANTMAASRPAGYAAREEIPEMF